MSKSTLGWELFKCLQVIGKTEVYDLDLIHLIICSGHHDVLGFEIPVDNAKAMHVKHSDNNLLENDWGIVLSQEREIFDKLEQVFSFT